MVSRVWKCITCGLNGSIHIPTLFVKGEGGENGGIKKAMYMSVSVLQTRSGALAMRVEVIFSVVVIGASSEKASRSKNF